MTVNNVLFHTLWDKAVGTEDYNKKEWMELERHLQAPTPLLSEITKVLWMVENDMTDIKRVLAYTKALLLDTDKFDDSLSYPKELLLIKAYDELSQPVKDWIDTYEPDGN